MMDEDPWEDVEAVPVLVMDEAPHFDMVTTGCCRSAGKRCDCGGWMHFEVGYGMDFHFQCEVCKRKEHR